MRHLTKAFVNKLCGVTNANVNIKPGVKKRKRDIIKSCVNRMCHVTMVYVNKYSVKMACVNKRYDA